MGKFEAVSGHSQPLIIISEGDTVVIPDADLLFSGDYARSGTDLILTGEAGNSVIVTDYFGDAGLPTLASPAGAVLMPDVVSALAGPQAPGQYAQASDAQAQPGIGSVVTLSGSATAQRGDGTVVSLAVDSRLAEGDVVQTGPGSLLGIVFDDGTVFNINADTRMVLDELVYEPGGDSNSMLFNVVQGVFAFVAGQVAPTGEMRIDTPVATMGVRGTSCLGQIEDVVIFRVVPDPVTNRVGACVLYSRETGLVLAISDSLETQLVFDMATGQLVEQPADPAHEDIIQRLHDTFVRFAGVPGEQEEDTQQAAQSGGSGLQTSFSLTPGEIATITALADGALGEIGSISSQTDSAAPPPDSTTESILTLTTTTTAFASVDTTSNTGTPVTPPNQSPLAADDQFATDENSAVNGNVLANDSDPDGDPLTVTHVNGNTASVGSQITLASGALLLLNADGSFSYDPNGQFDGLGAGAAAQDSFTYTVSDGQNSSEATVVIDIAGVNDAPVVEPLSGSVGEAGPSFSTDLLSGASDDGGAPSLQAVDTTITTAGGRNLLLGTHYEMNGSTFSLTADGFALFDDLAEGADDSFIVNFEVTDGTETVANTLTVTVQGANDAPVVEALVGSVGEDGPSFSTDLLTGASDVDVGDVLSVQNVDSSVTTAGGRVLTLGTHYTVTGGVFALTADGFALFDSLAEGVDDSFIVNFEITDGIDPVANTLTVTVQGANDAPVVEALVGSVGEDGPSFAIDLLSGASDVDSGDVLAVQNVDTSIVTAGERVLTLDTHYTVTDGVFALTADGFALFNDLAEGVDDSFIVNFEVTDGTEIIASSLTVTVQGANEDPVAVDDAFATDENTPVNGNVLVNDSDPDGDPLTVTRVNGSTASVGNQIVLASGALLLLQVDGSFAYDPNGQFDALAAGESAEDSFTYEVSDGQGGTHTATVTLTIGGVNDAPLATDSQIATNTGVSASGLLTGSDAEDGEAVTFALDEEPTQGTVTVNPDGSFTYTPGAEAVGPDSFTYTVTDSQGLSNTATVLIEIAPLGEAAEPKILNGTSGNDVLIGSPLNDVLSGGLGNDVLRSGGAPLTFFGLDELDGGPGDDTLIAEGGAAILVGGPGNDVLTSTDAGGHYDWVRADYRTSPAGIFANLTAAPIGDLASGEVADGFGTVDQVSNIHVLADSAHDDVIHVDSSYTNSFGNFIEVRLSGGDDTVVFDNVAHARINYNQAGGGVLADLETGTATDLNPGDNFIGNDTFSGKVHVLRGSHFNDVLLGSSGNDAFWGEGGDDYIDGRGGTNTIQFRSSPSGIHVDLSQNLVLNDGHWIEALARHGIDEVYNIHNVSGSDWDDLIIGDAGNNGLFGGLGNDTLLGGAGQDELRGGPGDDYLISGGATAMYDPVNNSYLFFEQDRLEGNEGNDTLVATGGDVLMFGGPGDDTIMSIDTGSHFDFSRVSYRSSPAGIIVGMNGEGGLTVQDGFGGTDTVWRVHVLNDSPHDDVIVVDSTYQTSFGAFFEVRLSGGDDTVTFDGFAGRIGYQGAGGGVYADLELGTARDLNAGDSFIGNDTFIGTVGVLRGSHFDDVLLGSSGNDALRGEGGDDIIDGRGGINSIQFGGSSSGVHVDLSQNLVLNDGIWIDALGRHGIDQLSNIQNVDGSDFDDLIIGDAGANRLRGALGDDVIHGGAGNDILIGDNGLSAEMIAAGASSNDILYGEDGDDSLYGGAGQDELYGGPGNDYLESGGATGGFDKVNNVYSFFEQDRLFGGPGNDTLVATGGDVVMVGGPGDDMIRSEDNAETWFDFTRVSYQSSPAGIVVTMDGSNLSVADGFGGTDTVSRVHVLSDSEFNDTITVDSNYQTSYGNFIEVRLGAGDDTVNFVGVAHARIGYQGAGGPVLIDLEAGTATDLIAGNNFIGNDQFFGTVHVARGTSFDDQLYGSSGDEAFRGQGGDDFIDGRGGIDAIQFAGSQTGVHVDLSQNLVLNDGHWIDALGRYGIDDVVNIENVVGSPFDDLIIGDAGANRLDGGLGADRLFGGAGNDVLVSGGATGALGNHGYEFYEQDYLDGGAGDDELIATGGDVMMVGGAGNDIIRSEDSGTSLFDFTRVSYQTSTSGIVAVMAGTSLSVQDGLGGTDTVSRVHVLNDSPHGDSITVDSNYETSFGAFLEVRLSSGDDTVEFIGFAGRIAYVGAGGGVRADLELGTATDVNPGDSFIGNDTFIGQVGLLRGSNFDDVLLGSSGNDAFRGHGGDDFIDGRGGINTVQFGGSEFGVHVDLSQNKVFADGHWNAAEGRYGIDELANIHNVRGSEFADLIIGDDGANFLDGGTGGDILVGGLGSDTLQGGGGIDRFVYRSPDDGGDTIIDFAVSEDVLVIDASAFGGGLVGGRGLNATQFVSGNAPTATEAHGQFLYDTSNGDLWWDGDGTGAQAAVHIASLSGTPALTAADFQLVPSAAGFVAMNDVVAALDAGEPVA